MEHDGSFKSESVLVEPLKSIPMDPVLHETSGLIVWDGQVWTHNDDSDTVLYGLDPNSARITKEYQLEKVQNIDWEEISQDEEYLYLGDFGNNRGKRTDLHILRIEKRALLAGDFNIDTIWFSYSNQYDFSPGSPYTTEFDCEAMILTGDSIYLFTKRWISAGTSIYSLPKKPGTHQAQFKSSLDFQGLVTGACLFESKRLIILVAYTTFLDPFFYILKDFSGTEFLSGNKRKVNMNLPLHQVEGVATADGMMYYVSNEKGTLESNLQISQSLHIFDLSPYL